jgi:hypothetical protein
MIQPSGAAPRMRSSSVRLARCCAGVSIFAQRELGEAVRGFWDWGWVRGDFGFFWRGWCAEMGTGAQRQRGGGVFVFQLRLAMKSHAIVGNLSAMSQAFPCPCCGYQVFSEPPGSYEICPTCFWEDDHVQLGFPLLGVGANRKSLYESQQEFCRVGACEARFVAHVRPPAADVQRDAEWRLFDPSRDRHLRWDSPEDHQRWREETGFGQNVCLYYWRADYWLA